MNILFQTHEFNIKEGGPCTKRVDSFARYLSKKGYNVIIITSSHNRKTESINNREYKVIYSYSIKEYKKSSIHRFLNNVIFGLTSFLKSIFIKDKIDVVITTSPPPLINIFGYAIAKIKKTKLIYDVRDIWPDVALEIGSFKENSIYCKIFSFIAKFMYKHSDIITTVTPGKVEKIKRYAKNKVVKYIPNGYDDNFEKFSLDKTLIDKYDLNKKFTVVYIGNVGLAQNLDVLVELAKDNINNKQIQFIIFGEGAYKKELESKIKKLNLENIRVAGRIDYSKVYTILSYAKISFISLKNNKMTDSVPTKIFDALGIGCPILLFAKGNSCEILEATGLGEHADNLTELKEKFNYMINNYENYNKKKKSAIQYIKKNYSREKIADRFEREVLKLC